GGQRRRARLGGPGGDARRELVGARGEQPRRAVEVVGALAEARGAPFGLGLAGALDRRAHVLGAVDLELAERLERGGVREPETPSLPGRRPDSLAHSHPLSPPPTTPSASAAA